MIQSKFRSFRPVGVNEQQTYSGVASLSPRPPPERSPVTESVMKRSHGCTVCGRFNPALHPKPSPKKIEFPNDKWTSVWNQCATQRTGSMYPRPPPERSPVTESVMKRIHGCTVCGRFNPGLALPPLSQQKKLRTDKQQKEPTLRKDPFIHLSTSVEYLKTSLHAAHPEDRSLIFSILQKDRVLATLKERLDGLEMEIKKLEERSKGMDNYRDRLLEHVPPEVQEMMERNVKATQADGTEGRNMMLLKSINRSMGSIAEQQKIVCQGITSRIELVERLKLEMKKISKKMAEDQKVLSEIKFERFSR
ncbi:uncharacterized protein LOC130560517 [Triplophysa rosa]|uniref:uncharacterized protein LOC130560517 n=1 Tax=Triplophysa rosa TaxID=992332 RepID=UPI002545C496|nr:uncharacterized protein LOC130560517 [Triplophysa rosa]